MTSLAPGAGLEINIEINIAILVHLQAHCFVSLHYLPHPPFFPPFFLPVSILSHFWKTGSKGVKLMWWKTTGISLWAICFAVMGTPSPLSVALGFLLRLRAYCKLASSYLRLPAKCMADLAPCQAEPSYQLRAPNFVSLVPGFLWPLLLCL